MNRVLVTLSLTIFSLTAFALSAAPADKDDLPLIFRDDFSKGADAWEPTDPTAWKVIETKDGKAFSQFQQSKFKPPHRSPFNSALVKDVIVGDFILDAEVLSTCRDYPHRDVCLIFGHQDPAHFYYVHFGKKTDDHANQIFIVNAKDRTKISTKTNEGTPWNDHWHHLRVTRNVADGSIAAYFDDLEKPLMTATDKTFIRGRVGVGSFDDTADWRNVTVRGAKVERK